MTYRTGDSPDINDAEYRFSGVFTCIKIANLRGSDSPPKPTPVHIECWEGRGYSGGYERVESAKKFVVRGEWYSSLPAHTKCYLCGEEI